LLVYESSLGDEVSFRSGAQTPAHKPERPSHQLEVAAEGCRLILDRMVDPAVEMCVVASEAKQRLVPSWDREVFIVNVMTYLQVSRYRLVLAGCELIQLLRHRAF
jgi:conserved oligomeric Golgi complex subunit 6